MAADLHIHVFEGITENDLSVFFSTTMGSKYFNPSNDMDRRKYDEVCDRISVTSNIWIGEVSWLKAALFDDEESYVPHPVAAISELIGEDLPTLTEPLAVSILEALATANQTGYGISEVEDVRPFLDAHKGKQLFTVSW